MAVRGRHCRAGWVSGRCTASFSSEIPSWEPSLGPDPLLLVEAGRWLRIALAASSINTRPEAACGF